MTIGRQGVRAAWPSLVLVLCAGLAAGGCSADSASAGSRDRAAAAQAEGAGGAVDSGSDPTDTPPPTDDTGFGNAEAGAPAPPTTTINPGGNDCAPGHYLGLLEGDYFSQAWGNGTASIPFATTEVMEQPGLEFWLERTERECTDAEFCADFEIRGGKLRGWAMVSDQTDPAAPSAAGVQARFEMELAGELDCRTGELRGMLLNGCYDILGTLYRMEGDIEASYDKAADAFVMGSWDLVEMPLPNLPVAPDPNIGGTGSWNAMLADDGSSPIAEGDGLCDKVSGFDTQL
ncbi:MAG: hypothetical protein OXT09_20260 [Myxococcales bacterium]|nr:hypothetical protein [Myxococcales bacterium]